MISRVATSYTDPAYHVGMRIGWETIGGDWHEGRIEDIEEGEAVVLCDDGQKRAVGLD